VLSLPLLPAIPKVLYTSELFSRCVLQYQNYQEHEIPVFYRWAEQREMNGLCSLGRGMCIPDL